MISIAGHCNNLVLYDAEVGVRSEKQLLYLGRISGAHNSDRELLRASLKSALLMSDDGTALLFMHTHYYRT